MTFNEHLDECPQCSRNPFALCEVGARLLHDVGTSLLQDVRRTTTTLIADELAAKAPMDLMLRPFTVFQMVGMVQLALRHPHVPANIREAGERFLAGAREYFADCPQTLAVVRMGDDPAYDMEDVT